MENPFHRRAAELLRDNEAFLAIVSPDPVTYFLGDAGRSGRLYDRLVSIRGTPGSGKTTLARLFEFPTIHAILRNRSFEGYKELAAALSECGAVRDDHPIVLGCRLPLETDYRDLWESPYAGELKANLMTTLLQARSVLAWFRHLRGAGIDAATVELQVRPEAVGLLDTIGGSNGERVRTRAAEVEHAVYRIMTSLVAPPEHELPPEAVSSYRPFDFIDRVRIPGDGLGIAGILDLLPLAIFDDAHVLHPDQFKALERFLIRRELHIARWMIARFDVLIPEEALAAVVEDRSATFPGLIADRESEPILLQSSGKRRNQRERFRILGKDMAGRYLRRMPLFSERNLTVLGNLLGDRDVSMAPGYLKELESEVSSAKTRLRISDAQRLTFEEQIRAYWGDKTPLPPDVSLSMLYVMMNRYDVRRRRAGPSLFGDDEEADVEDSVVVAANDAVYEAAIFQLFHRYDRPYYFGIDDVCDASSENAELFLHLSAELVEAVATQIARNRPATLVPAMQERLLRERASKITADWNFPQDDAVRALTKNIANRCLRKSLEPNGSVIANAFGIPQSEFDSITQGYPRLSRVLQFAVAYNAITLVPYHSCKKKEWCLLELGGPVLLKHGLTLKRGGFIEGTASDLERFLTEAKP